MKKFFKSIKIFAFILTFTFLFSAIACFGALNANAESSELQLLTIAVSHLSQRVDDLEEAVANSDMEAINARIEELEKAIADAETAAKAYADAQGESLKKELTAAIESAKTELAAAINKKADAEAANAKIAELKDAIISAEAVARTYTDTQNAALKNELLAAIEAAKLVFH